MPDSYLSLTNTRQDTRQQVSHYGSSNQEFVDTSVRTEMKRKGGGGIMAGVPHPLSPIPLPFSLPPQQAMARIILAQHSCHDKASFSQYSILQ